MSTCDRVDIGNCNLLNSDSFVGGQVKIVQSDYVVGYDHKVEIVPKTERVQQDPLRLSVMEGHLVALSLLYKQHSQFCV